MSTTRWIDKVSTDLDRAIESIISEKNLNCDTQVESSLFKNWKFAKKHDENKIMAINNRNITYNFIEFSVDRIDPGLQPEIDRTHPINGFVIPYFNGSVNYIINRNSNAQSLLRKILGYTGKGEIEKNMSPITSDMFFWLISKVYHGEEVIDNDAINFNIEMVRGIKGDTDDSLSKVRADGETVLNIISTLSFFLESNSIDRIRIDIAYQQHDNIELVLNTNDCISIIENTYIGPFNNGNDSTSCKAELYLLTYIEIIPMLIQEYNSAIEDGLWNREQKVNFLNNVATELSERVEGKIEMLRNNR